MASNIPYTGNYVFGENGVIIPDTADILTTVQDEYKAALGLDLSLEEATPQGRLIDTEVTARREVLNFNAQIANVFINITMSSGLALDAWGANFNLPRNGAKASTVTVLVTGIPDTVISAGSQAATSNGIIWIAQSEIIIGKDGTATGTFICTQMGAVALGINELTTIISGVTTGLNGWETITNTTVALLGNDRESDASYKTRLLQSLFIGTALFGNYKSNVRRVEGVEDVFAKENPHGKELILDDIIIPPHSVFVCVDGGNTEDVAYALYEVKSAGAGWMGNTIVTVTDKEFNTTNTVLFSRPMDTPFIIDVAATNLMNSNSDLVQEIKNVIIGYFTDNYVNINYQKPGIRGRVSPVTISSLLKTQIPNIQIDKVTIGLLVEKAHAIPNIIKASVTSGINWASIITDTFGEKIGQLNGTYNFNYDGTNWLLDGTSINLSEYGLTVTGEPISGDIISVLYSNGKMSQSPIMVFASEIPTIASENITVVING